VEWEKNIKSHKYNKMSMQPFHLNSSNKTPPKRGGYLERQLSKEDPSASTWTFPLVQGFPNALRTEPPSHLSEGSH
jgi:hypothetical protein